MSLFDQQPMGPIPARHPVRYLPDPELDAAGVDPAAEIELVEPPLELVDPVPTSRRPGVRHVITWLLLVPFALALILSAVPLVNPEGADDRLTAAYLISAAVVLAVIGTAYLIFRRSLPKRST